MLRNNEINNQNKIVIIALGIALAVLTISSISAPEGFQYINWTNATGFNFNLSGYPILNISATIECGANMSCSQTGTILIIDSLGIPGTNGDDENYYYNILNSRIEPDKIKYYNLGKNNISFSDSILILSSYIIDPTGKGNFISSNAMHIVPSMMGHFDIQGEFVSSNTIINGSTTYSGFIFINMNDLSTNGKSKYYQRIKRLYNGSISWSNISSQFAGGSSNTRYINFTSNENGALIIMTMQETIQYLAFSDSTKTYLYSGSIAGEELNTDLNGNAITGYSGKRASTPIMLAVPPDMEIQFWIKPSGNLQDTRAVIYYAQLPSDW